ncbi:MAG: hypothetical protein E7813_05095 [Bradyrhizobium sp.]|uniref:DUF5672 family protein n=1 Tax=Bradyrhizobium sp. TaxID=376 RepID=UPI00120BAFAE|nr:DUF5672 family protein [Bradyrhizobium sp.]THD71659.1 MAG: hypothetical protein E7813_05095 [Bradyrhizobium sp.]
MQPKLKLPSVTLITVTSVDIEKTNAALLHCCTCAEFGAVKMLCSQPPRLRHPQIQYIAIPSIDFLGYSRFIIEDLNKFVETEHCLIVQADGFIVDPARWQPRFLKFDYIGAPWPEYVGLNGPGHQRFRFGKNRVGNGGFSLRSKKLLEATAQIRFDQLNLPIKSEDIVICHYYFADLRSAGIRFAPSTLAARFSIEIATGNATLNSVFGFHGKHWLPAVYRAYPWLQV